MVIQIDAWNIRQRDDWGRTAALRRAGQEPEHWHWVYTGTVLRLDHRGHTAGGRAVISERGFVGHAPGGSTPLREPTPCRSAAAGLGASGRRVGDRRWRGVDLAFGR